MNQKVLTTKKNKQKQKQKQKFQLIQIVRLQVMHDYVHWHCSITVLN